MKEIKPIKISTAFLLFAIPGMIFYILIKIMMPVLLETTTINPFLVWIILGTCFLFGPLFFLSLHLLKRDGYPISWESISARFRLRRLTGRDWLWILGGMLAASAITGLIIGLWTLSPLPFSLDELRSFSPIQIERLEGSDRWIFFPMLVLLFFNYFGEEFMWRGYILPRQEEALGKWAWPVNAGLHLIFHFLFGLKALLLFLPYLLAMPYVAYKTRNTYTSIIIHAMLSAPIWILITLGIVTA
ncbi:MAG: CPBP family intramembrane metalloprotease [Anaerolineales bacterium]|nr:CPBP family intramembrane metalloprotease [Anaerolineales bacterium]